MTHTIYIGLGSNIAPRIHSLRKGLRLLNESGVRITKVSSLYRTSPVGYRRQPYFLNAVIEVRSSLEPMALLNLLKEIETRVGRVPGKRFGPRKLDLDLLLYGRKSLKTKRLTIPHPRMTKRRFVLVPLIEIAPKSQYFKSLKSNERVIRYRKKWISL